MCLVTEMTDLTHGSSTFYSIIHMKETITLYCQSLLPQSFEMNGKKLAAPCKGWVIKTTILETSIYNKQIRECNLWK